MIQRIQTVYLAIVELLGFGGGLLIFLQSDPSTVQNVFGAAMIVIAFLQMPLIILFKKRAMQIMLCKAMLIILLGISSFSILFSEELAIGIGSTIPVIQFLLVFLALRAIKKDEELIRSVDRIR